MCMLCTSFQAEGVTGARALAVTSAMPENSLRKPSGRTTSILQRLATNGALRMCSNSYAHTEVAQSLSNDEFVQYIRSSPQALADSRCEANSATNLSRHSPFFTNRPRLTGKLPIHSHILWRWTCAAISAWSPGVLASMLRLAIPASVLCVPEPALEVSVVEQYAAKFSGGVEQ